MTHEEVIPSVENTEVNNDALPDSQESNNNQGQQPAAEATVDGYEDRAKLQGWKPKEEFVGNPDNWVDAKSYVERADNELPIAKATIRNLENRMTQMQESFEKMRKFEMERAKAQALEDLRSKHTRAIDEDGVSSVDAFKAFETEKANIEKQYAEPQAQQVRQTPYEVQQWINDNSWANAQDELGLYARAMEMDIGRNNPYLPPLQILSEVKKRAMARFPERFNNPKRQVQSIEGGRNIHGAGNQKLSINAKFGKLSAIDQQLGRAFIKDGTFKDEAAFIKSYELAHGEIK